MDEVGRGCLAGAVVAAACILDLAKPLPEGLNDSKQITAKKREEIAEELKQNVIAYGHGPGRSRRDRPDQHPPGDQKSDAAGDRKAQPKADFLLIDAVPLKEVNLPQKAIIKGDSISASIAAASILAKTYRDNLMRELDKIYPEYGFSKHVGYGTKAHFEAIRKHGACPLHRKSFRGVL